MNAEIKAGEVAKYKNLKEQSPEDFEKCVRAVTEMILIMIAHDEKKAAAAKKAR